MKKKLISMTLALSCAVVWSFAFPLIKIGLELFEVAPGDTGAKTLFAGIRFLAAGVFVLITSKFAGRDMRIKTKNDLFGVLLFGLVNTALHYFFYYIGLSNQSGSRSAVIDSMSTFILIVLACIIFKDEKMTALKAAGCLLGICGIITVNLGGQTGESFTLSGDGMLILSAVFSALGGILTRIVSKNTDILAATGISLSFGGMLMMIFGFFMGGRLNVINVQGVLIMLALILISVYGFSVYNKLLCSNPVGDIAIFNSLIPILGVLLSCLILSEPFRIQYAAAGFLSAAGVLLVNIHKENSKNNSYREETI